ncbi:MAG: Ppx/GppA phosphatase family protein [Coriobacteriia bacterium]
MIDGPRRLAAIDIGTVTTRLLIADVTATSVAEIGRSCDITHLGRDLTRTGRLSDSAMHDVARVIERYAATIADLGATGVVAIATSASRDAENAEEFLALLEHSGIRPVVIEGSREAYLSFTGATFGLEVGRVLIDDIGGGSTELVWGHKSSENDERVIDLARSIDVGSRRLTEMFLHTDPPTAAEMQSAREYAASAMRPYFDALSERPELLVSVAGTATSLAAIRMKMAVYDPDLVHGYILSGHDVADLVETLAAMPLARRSETIGLHPGRASVIVAGAMILEAVMGLAGTDSTMVSERDILYGILLDAYMNGAGA